MNAKGGYIGGRGPADVCAKKKIKHTSNQSADDQSFQICIST